MAAVKATVAFVLQVEDNIRGHFLDALPLLLEVSFLVESLTIVLYGRKDWQVVNESPKFSPSNLWNP